MRSSSESGPSRQALAADAAPIADAELAGLFRPLAVHRGLALAVSGGSDSLALLVLAARWRALTPSAPPVTVLTVDHRLRPSSGDEAAMVCRVAGAAGLTARILVWQSPSGDGEAAAREARYRLLAEGARAAGADAIVLAHHREDQAETFLMRLAAGSGPSGLAAMAVASERHGVRLLRPFLAVPKARLAATVSAAGIAPAVDESNRDPRYLRPRLRRMMPALAAEGLGPPRLAATADRMRRVAEAIDHYAGALLAGAAACDGLAVVRLAAAPFVAAPLEIRIRALERLLAAIGGGTYPPRSERLEAVETAMRSGLRFRRTLSGVTVEHAGDGFRFYRETGRAGLPVVAVGGRFRGLWDGRFAVEVRGEAPGITLAALGSAGRRDLGLRAGGRPVAALEALPAIRCAGRLVAVPPLGIAAAPGEGVAAAARCILAEEILRQRPATGIAFTLE